MRLTSGTVLRLLLVQPIASANAKPPATQPPAKDLAVLKQVAGNPGRLQQGHPSVPTRGDLPPQFPVLSSRLTLSVL